MNCALKKMMVAHNVDTLLQCENYLLSNVIKLFFPVKILTKSIISHERMNIILIFDSYVTPSLSHFFPQINPTNHLLAS